VKKNRKLDEIVRRGYDALEQWYKNNDREVTHNKMRRGYCGYCGKKLGKRRMYQVSNSDSSLSTMACCYRHENLLKDRFNAYRYAPMYI